MALPVVAEWFARRTIEDGVTHLTEVYADPLIRCNIWHIRGRDRDLVIDSGLGIARLREAARDLFETSIIALATHGHYDHIGGMHEFETRVIHRAEAKRLEKPPFATLLTRDFPEGVRQELADAGYPVGEELVTAYPRADFDPAQFRTRPAAPTRLVDEGDVIDLGDRVFEVLHLPGHSPGSIGLWEKRTATLFSGDAIYDGPLLDELPGSDIDKYIATMKRLRDLPLRVVHAGHDPSFGRERLIEIADAYLRKRELSQRGAAATKSRL
ncbi:MAG: MBL fold metallo-hydrolase [Candidatus Hydrogenedentota bacterium]